MPASAQSLVQSDAAAELWGTYNASLEKQVHPRVSDNPPVEAGTNAVAEARLQEGGLSGTARGRVNGKRLSAGIFLQASPSLNLGGSTAGSAAAEYSEIFRFFFLRRSVYARAVGRLQGTLTFSNTPGMSGHASYRVEGLTGIDNAAVEPDLAADGQWDHFPPGRTLLRQRVDETFYVPVSDNYPNFAQILFQPKLYTLRVILKVNASVVTGHDGQGNALAASGSFSLGATLADERLGPAEPSIRAPEGGASIVGLQFLDEDMNVVDHAPGDVGFESSSGIVYPVLGSTLPWLSGADDFNNNQKDTSTWGDTVGTGSLHEVEFSLEYRTAESGTHSAAWPLKSHRAPLTESWEVQTDVHLEPVSLGNAGDVYGAGLVVSTSTHSAEVRMERTRNGVATERRFRGTGTGAPSPQESSSPAPQADGAVRLSYNAITNVLSYWYDTDGPRAGYTWTLLQKTDLGPAGWNLPAATLLTVSLGGASNGPVIPAGTVWMDDFSAASWTPVAANLGEIELAGQNVMITGVAEPDLPLTLQASDNLVDWSAISQLVPPQDGILNFTAPADRPARFFRLRY